MMKGGHGQTNQLQDINWGALNHASCASQLMSCKSYVHVCVYYEHSLTNDSFLSVSLCLFFYHFLLLSSYQQLGLFSLPMVARKL